MPIRYFVDCVGSNNWKVGFRIFLLMKIYQNKTHLTSKVPIPNHILKYPILSIYLQCTLLHFQVPRLCLPWYSSDDCQLFPFGTDGGSLETPTPDGSPWGPHLSSGSFDRMCRQTGTPVTFRLITWCAMSHTGKVISTSTTHKSTQNFQYIVHSSHTGCLRWIGDILELNIVRVFPA